MVNYLSPSNYKEEYEEGKLELMPWHFWTEEEKSQVIYSAFKEHYLTSKQVKPYLNAARNHMYTQFLGPIIAGVAYFGFARHTVALSFYRRSPTIGHVVGAGFVALSSILWLNLNPFYLNKFSEQERTLDVLYHKIGTSMKMLNDLVPRTRTTTDIDVRTRMIYSKRNGLLSGTIFAEDDYAPPILPFKPTHNFSEKKVYQ